MQPGRARWFITGEKFKPAKQTGFHFMITRSRKGLARVNTRGDFGFERNKTYEKLSMLNEAYEKELVRLGVDLKAIKEDIGKRFVQEKQQRENKDERVDKPRGDESNGSKC
ncbi:uncharacterized protein A4U43_C07F31570 [Asparagus officinalis]|uniref:Uncharacterized protein n=1 Tax=Asparagus officinalis TaxID=4686 RepID=A0A5P1EJG5_ASPOF|nr:uncharacterized protein A4U43_C07F31570 [Asparagus officinalis]